MANASEQFRHTMSQHAGAEESHEAAEAGFKALNEDRAPRPPPPGAPEAASPIPTPPVAPEPPETAVPEGENAPEAPPEEAPAAPEAAEEAPVAAESAEDATGEEIGDLVELPDGTRLPVSELVRGHLRESDYTVKTQELASQRREFEQERQNTAQQITTNMQHVQGLAQQLESEIGRHQMNQEQWAQLRRQDPAEFAARLEENRQRQELVRVAHEQSALLQQQQVAQVVPQQRSLLAQKIPAFEKDFATEYKALGDYATSPEGGGLARDEWDQLVDHRHVTLVWKAQQYDKAARSAPRLPKKLPRNTPKVLRPGVQRDSRDTVTEGFATALARQRESGGGVRSTADAFRAMEELRRAR